MRREHDPRRQLAGILGYHGAIHRLRGGRVQQLFQLLKLLVDFHFVGVVLELFQPIVKLFLVLVLGKLHVQRVQLLELFEPVNVVLVFGIVVVLQPVDEHVQQQQLVEFLIVSVVFVIVE